MSAGCLRWLLGRAASGVRVGVSGRPASRFLMCSGSCDDDNSKAPSWGRSSSSSAAGGDSGEEGGRSPAAPQDLRARTPIASVGRKIAHPLLRVIGDAGEDLGAMRRADALRLMDERALKLVLLSGKSDPPVYRLMSGKQIHEEQMKQREKQNNQARPVQVKAQTFSSDIAANDLRIKLQQVQSWLEKKHHVRMTLRARRKENTLSLDTNLEQIVQQIEIRVGFVTKPALNKDGRAATCVLRPPSKKELSQQGQNKPPAENPTQPRESTNTPAESSTQPRESTNTPADSPTDKTKDVLQQ